MPTRFRDRASAGRSLAGKLTHLRGRDAIVLALPRGGLPVAYEVAHALRAPLDVINVRKLGVPWHEELAMGAIATGGVRVLNENVIMAAGVTQQDLDQVTKLQQLELDRRERLYRSGREAPPLHGRVVVLVDDGVATGATVRAAISVVRAQKPARLVLAVPVVQASVAETLANEVDELAYVLAPADLYAIGVWYDHFPQLTDDDVRTILARSAGESAAAPRDARA
ncbi:MAG TPA: phosphoribosyltransferase [Gemmatimonadaceae bacterium]|nr:phosphoribosyltransferase [Gemmatimonadaceae bacterium]